MRRFSGAAALAVAAAGLTALPSPALAAGGATLYVDGAAPHCSDSGTGTLAAPYCSIQAAVDAAGPGDTVAVAAYGGFPPGPDTITLTHSGTAAAPITIEPYSGSYFGGYNNGHTSVVIDGASNIVLDGLETAADGSPAVTVTNAQNVVIQHSSIWVGNNASSAGVVATGAGTSVTVRQDVFGGESGGPSGPPSGTGVALETGASGVIADDLFVNQLALGVAVDGASSADVVADTFTGTCGTSIQIAGGSTDVVVENDVVGNDTAAQMALACTATPPARALYLDGASTGVTEGHNSFSTAGGQITPYVWSGSDYTTAAAFQKATGQGAADDVESSIDFGGATEPTSPALIGTADPTAAGQPAVDFYGNAPVVSPPDRGAIQYQEATGATLGAVEVSPQFVLANFTVQGIPWGAADRTTIDWGDGTADTTATQPTTDTSVDYTALESVHQYPQAGTFTITYSLTDAAQTFTKTTTVTTSGSLYAPVNPTRVLDTRKGVGAPVAQVPAGHSITVDTTAGVTGAPAASSISAVVMNVTVVNPAGSGHITAYPDGTTVPVSSNLNFTAGETVPNLVTVKAKNGVVDLYNGSTGTVDLVADVEGYYVYGGVGSGYMPQSPQRILDTRKGIGAPVAQVGTNAVLPLQVAGAGGVPATGATAVALNVTATKSSAPTDYLTVYPDQTTRPTASSLNFTAGETVANLVIVPLGPDGKVDFYNESGATDIVADVEGYYTAAGGDVFVPIDPTRLLDTRNNIGYTSSNGPVPSFTAVTVDAPYEDFAEPALVMNVTVTKPTALSGYITAYPDTGEAPPTASNLNFTQGQTVPNLVMAQTGLLPETGGYPGSVELYNGSGGTVQLVADLFGYFM